MYYNGGQGVPRDYAEAAKWFHLAADQRDAHAQNNLGLMYAQGQGVPQDIIRAHMWFNLSAMQNYQEAIRNRDMAIRRMTPAQIADAQKLARDWKPKPER
jgi:TPR repeat protein